VIPEGFSRRSGGNRLVPHYRDPCKNLRLGPRQPFPMQTLWVGGYKRVFEIVHENSLAEDFL